MRVLIIVCENHLRLERYLGMIVDCHTHFSADGRVMSEHLGAAEPVDKCIVLGTPEPAVEDINERLAQYVSSHRDKVTGFAFIEPTLEVYDARTLRSVTGDMGLCGTVVYCAQRGFHPAHSRAMRFYEAAEELGLPVFFHNGPKLKADSFLEYAQPMLLDGIARTFRKLKIIIGDIGLPFVEQTYSMLAKHENVYADFTINPERSWQTFNIVLQAYENKVMDKLLFGSGFPLGRAERCIEVLLGFNKLLIGANLPTVPRAEIRDFLERDTLAVLGIREPNSK
jgi:predicted TIM-barrel fold metal-dependent hydrolase